MRTLKIQGAIGRPIGAGEIKAELALIRNRRFFIRCFINFYYSFIIILWL